MLPAKPRCRRQQTNTGSEAAGVVGVDLTRVRSGRRDVQVATALPEFRDGTEVMPARMLSEALKIKLYAELQLPGHTSGA